MGDAEREGDEVLREPEGGGAPGEAAAADDADERPTLSNTGPGITVSVAGKTDVGLVRDHNEDNFLLADLGTGETDPAKLRVVGQSGCVLAVCDGMGGAAAGEVASQMAVDTILEALREATPASDRDGFAHALVRAVERAGARIFAAANDDRSRRGMGTTATVAALMDKTLFVGQVGDSRAYVLRQGQLKQLTKDQSLVNQLIEAGQLTEDEAEAFEHSNIILQALGTTDQVSVDLTFLELRKGDRVMLCSDGLSGLVHADIMRDVLIEYDDLDACCDRLIELAKGGGGHDNITVIVAELDGEGLAPPADGDFAGYVQYPLPLQESDDGGDAGGAEGRETSDNLGSSYSVQADPAGRGSRRYLAVALVLLGLAFAVYYWSGAGSDPDQGVANGQAHDLTAPPPPPEPQPVEVVVRTDVENSELHVDGASYGAPDGDRWLLDLLPGPHRLEALAGGHVVASSDVTVREGIPATVFLSMPEVSAEPGATESDAAEPRSRQPRSAEPGASKPGADTQGARRRRVAEQGATERQAARQGRAKQSAAEQSAAEQSAAEQGAAKPDAEGQDETDAELSASARERQRARREERRRRRLEREQLEAQGEPPAPSPTREPESADPDPTL